MGNQYLARPVMRNKMFSKSVVLHRLIRLFQPWVALRMRANELTLELQK